MRLKSQHESIPLAVCSQLRRRVSKIRAGGRRNNRGKEGTEVKCPIYQQCILIKYAGDATLALLDSQFRMAATHPMDQQYDLAFLLIYLHDNFADENLDDALFQPHVRRR